MDWEAKFAQLFQPLRPPPPEEEMEEDNEEDFYGSEDTKAGAGADSDAGDLLNSLLPKETVAQPQPPKPEQTANAEERQAENKRRAELLRAQLMAKRQNTPMKPATPRAATPANMLATPQQPAKTPATVENVQKNDAEVFTFGEDGKVQQAGMPSSDSLGLDTLIAEGRRAAEAKAIEQVGAQTNGQQHAPSAPANHVVKPADAPAQIEMLKPEHTPRPDTTLNTPATAEKTHPHQLTDAYYADLSAWLEITGYHDVNYRNTKLRTYKERKALEEEKAKIQAKLDQLNREDEAERAALRSSTIHPSSSAIATAPPLPATMPSGDKAAMAAVAEKLTNGVKRAHSPTPLERNNRRREEPSTNGFRIRGANDSPTSPRGFERRVSYPDARRRSFEDIKSRDPSLERRQAYYKRDGERPPPPPRAEGRYDQYTPRDVRETPRTYSGRGGGYGSVGRGGGRGGYGRDYDQQYRGSAGLDLPRGGKSSTSSRRDLLC